MIFINNETYLREHKKLREMYQKAKQMLIDIGFEDITVNEIRLNNRLRTTLGWYISSSKTIEISTRHFICSTYDEVMNTILHEISHNICENRYGEKEENGGHTKEWYEIAKYITKETGYNIKPISSITEDNNKIISKPKYYYCFKCKRCGHQYTAYSFKEDANQVKKRKCIGCLSAYKILGEEYSKGEFVCIKNGISHYEYEYVQERS